jgi:mannose-6-phosphate isomerase-like protein (cupin superfamily)
MAKHISQASIIEAPGNIPKIIQEVFGRVNSGDADISIAHMKSPAGWSEPGQTPEFAEYTYVLNGSLKVELVGETLVISAGEAVTTSPGEWVRYSSPEEDGAEYIAICIPAFSPDLVHRDHQ